MISLLAALVAGSCGLAVQGAEGPVVVTTEPDTPVADAKLVVCDRVGIVPEPDDDSILTELKLPLLVRAGERAATLEMHDGQFVYGLLKGTATPGESQAIAGRLEEFQARLQRQIGD